MNSSSSAALAAIQYPPSTPPVYDQPDRAVVDSLAEILDRFQQQFSVDRLVSANPVLQYPGHRPFQAGIERLYIAFQVKVNIVFRLIFHFI
jgi:hypothetical protein